MKHIETISLSSGSAASLVFSNIPAIYTDLLLVTSIRDTSGGFQLVLLDINSSSVDRRFRTLYGNGVGGVSSQNQNDGNPQTMIGLVNGAPGGSVNITAYTSVQIYFPNYRSSASKTFTADCVAGNNATENYSFLTAGLWEQSAPITSLTLRTTNSIAQYSSASLYGITAGSDGITTVS